MAVIDISLINVASPILVFLLFFIGGWAILQTVNPFKDVGKNFYGLLAFLVAIALALSSTMVQIVLTATPWLVFLVMIGFFMIFFSLMFGVKQDTITAAFSGPGQAWMIVLLIIVILFSVGGALGPGLLSAQTPGQGSQTPNTGNLSPTEPVFDANGNLVPAGSIGQGTGQGSSGIPTAGVATDDFGSNLIFTLFHPKVLGVLFLFLLGAMTIVLLNKAT